MAIKYDGIISPDNLENQRKAGLKDDAIADQMAQASPVFASQLSKIRKKYGGDSAATTAFLNTRFYGAVDHTPEQPKGLIGRSLERIYQNYKKDIVDIGQSLEDRSTGKQGFVDTTLQVAGNLMSLGASPVSQPLQETVGTIAKGAYNNIPYVKPIAQEIGRSDIVQKGVLPAIQSTSQFLQQESERNPALRSLASVGEGLSDLTDVYAGGALAKGAVNVAKPVVKGALQGAKSMATSPFQTLGQVAGATARVGTQPIRSGFKGFMQGVRGQADDVTKQIAQNLDNGTMQLSGVTKEAVSAGMDEKVIKFAVAQSPETKKAMSSMAKAASKGATKLGGDTAHKEILGSYMLNNIDHVVTEKEIVGKALGAMKKGMVDEVIDMTDDLVDLRNELSKVGAVINEKGRIVRLAAEADDNIPLLQEALDFLQPDDAGRVVKRFGDVDMWRSKMFKEMNSAKAKMQPSSGGQSVFGYSEKVVNNLRRSAIKNASSYNPRLLAYNDAFEELSTQTSTFLKKIGYKGRLDIDSITAKDLRTGEIALRSLGNASADVRDTFSNLIKTARKYGYNSGVDEDALIRWADTLEDLFPISPTRSLQGGVSRGTKDALGNFTEDVLRSGAKRGVTQVVSEKVMEGINYMRGMTPENQYRLLLEILDAPPDTPLFNVIDDVIDNVPTSLKKTIDGVDVEDVRSIVDQKKVESLSQVDNSRSLQKQLSSPTSKVGQASPPTIQGQSTSVNPIEAATQPQSAKTDSLTPEEILKLTPEEKATGLMGRGEAGKTVASSIDNIKSDAIKSVHIAEDAIRSEGLIAKNELKAILQPYKELKDQSRFTVLDAQDFGDGQSLVSDLLLLQRKGAFKYKTKDIQGGIDTLSSAFELLENSSLYHEGKPIQPAINKTLNKWKEWQPSAESESAFEQGIREGWDYLSNDESIVENMRDVMHTGYIKPDTVVRINNKSYTYEELVKNYEDAISLAKEKSNATRAKNLGAKTGGNYFKKNTAPQEKLNNSEFPF